MRAQRITKVELAGRLGVSESAVRKLINPDHRSRPPAELRAPGKASHSRVYVDAPALAAGWLYVAAKTVSESHRRNDSLSLNSLNSSV